ncbi:MAG TPA: long-chain fatty acid--CoA ligase [Rhizomicrobium sp.]|nr:long-chain fatty acid--CoA ligase [Rhizomicrobium sp.]
MRITQSLHRAVSVRPHAIATIDEDRKRTWREVEDRVARFAHVLRDLGAGVGDRVAILAQNCDTFYEAYYAVMWAGAVLVPLNTRLSPAEIAFQLDDAGVKVVLYSREFANVVAALRERGTRTFLALDEAAAAADPVHATLLAKASRLEDCGRGGEDLAAIFYTGGTTGLPKGVMLSHRALTAMAVNLIMALRIDEDCVNLHSAPMFHLADIGTIMTTMVAGTHVFVRRLDEPAMFDSIERHGVSHIFTVPAVIDRLARHDRAATADLSSLKFLGYGGAPMHMAVLDRARARFPGVDFGQGFGMTEMGAATFLGPKHHRAGADAAKLKSAGQPCYGYELKVIGPDGAELPRGVIGEIVGRGDNVMLGYWNRPAETAEVLKDGWMHTRDAGFMDDDGFITITDRLKDMIVTGAENVYSIEVENVVLQHPAVSDCAVIGVPDEKWGERVHAVVVLKPGAAVALDGLSSFCRDRIAGYKCPKSLEIRAEPLPRSAAGKVLKTELRQPHWAGRERRV